MKSYIDLQGHRGCRGLFPENTIPAFEHAIDLGVGTLELDVVISKDKQVIVSHEPFFNHEISKKPDGTSISETDEKSYNIYELNYQEIKAFDVGTKEHPRFQGQRKMKVHKPSLADMVLFIEHKIMQEEKPRTSYNIEIKRKPEGDGIFHPSYTEFADLVIKQIEDLNIMDRTTVQCFDVETLQYIHIAYPHVRLVYLIENVRPFKENLAQLGFSPHVYSPYHKLISKRVVRQCEELDIKLIPWTVNDAVDLEELMKIGVDGIISDYPDRMIEVYNKINR